MTDGRLPPLIFLSLLALLMTCSETGGAYYSPADDDEAMAAIAKCWLPDSQGGLVLTLAEDLEASAAVASGGCAIAHVVRGGGVGEAHQGASGGGGCDGCAGSVVAFVEGTVEDGPLAGVFSVRGRVTLGSNSDSNPYEFPYAIDLETGGDGEPFRVEGELSSDGLVSLRVSGVSLDPEELAKEHFLEPVDW